MNCNANFSMKSALDKPSILSDSDTDCCTSGFLSLIDSNNPNTKSFKLKKLEYF